MNLTHKINTFEWFKFCANLEVRKKHEINVVRKFPLLQYFARIWTILDKFLYDRITIDVLNLCRTYFSAPQSKNAVWAFIKHSRYFIKRTILFQSTHITLYLYMFDKVDTAFSCEREVACN